MIKFIEINQKPRFTLCSNKKTIQKSYKYFDKLLTCTGIDQKWSGLQSHRTANNYSIVVTTGENYLANERKWLNFFKWGEIYKKNTIF